MKDKRPENRSSYSSLFFSVSWLFFFPPHIVSSVFSYFLFISLTFYSSTFFSSSTLSLFHHYTFLLLFGEKLLCIVLYWEINNTHSKYWVNPILQNIVNPIQYPIRIARPCSRRLLSQRWRFDRSVFRYFK